MGIRILSTTAGSPGRGTWYQVFPGNSIAVTGSFNGATVNVMYSTDRSNSILQPQQQFTSAGTWAVFDTGWVQAYLTNPGASTTVNVDIIG